MGIGKSIAALFIGWAMATYLGTVCKNYMIASARKPVISGQ